MTQEYLSAMQYRGARMVATAWVEAVTEGAGAILDEHTIDRPYGWVFFYQSKRFIETRNPLDGFVGNAPIIINRFTGELRVTGTAHPVDHYIAEYETTLSAAQLTATPERRERADPGSP
jgi:hypothetical protein